MNAPFRICRIFVAIIQNIFMKLSFSKNKNKTASPSHHICRNCSTPLIARYCHQCGQDSRAGSERTIGEILYNAVDTIFAWDNKIFRTLKYLVLYPGKLTKEFFDGRIVQYVYPAKLFWFLTILFFAMLSWGDEISHSPDSQNIKINVNSDVPSETPVVPVQTERVEEEMEEPVVKKEISVSPPVEIDPKLREKDEKISSIIRQHLVSYIPYVVFLLIPFFSFLLFLFFYKKKPYYANHMIFALHFHSFVFLLFTVIALVNQFAPTLWGKAGKLFMFFLPAIYLARALHVAYRPSLSKLLWKIPLIMIVYGIICIAMLVAFVLLLAWIAEQTYQAEVL